MEWLFRCAVSLVGLHTKYSEYRDLLNNDPCEIERLHRGMAILMCCFVGRLLYAVTRIQGFAEQRSL